MEQTHDIKGILFNFSGTIDTEGCEWFDLIWRKYRETGIPVSKSDYLCAHEYAEAQISERIHAPFEFFHMPFPISPDSGGTKPRRIFAFDRPYSFHEGVILHSCSCPQITSWRKRGNRSRFIERRLFLISPF